MFCKNAPHARVANAIFCKSLAFAVDAAALALVGADSQVPCRAMSELSAAARGFFEQGRLLDLAGLRVFVLYTGPVTREDALVLLHGFPSSSLDFHRILPRLAEGRRVVLLDFPGFGYSDKPQAYGYSLMEQADVVLMVLRALGVRSMQLVAHDMGTSVACELLARRERGLLPVPVTALVLMNGSVHIELAQLTPSQKLLGLALGQLFARLSSRAVFLAQLRRILGRPVPAEDLEDMWALLLLRDGRLRLPQSIAYIEERRRFWQRWIGALTRLDLPTLILWGDQDPVAVPAIAKQLQAEIPGARLQWLPDLGHYPQLEDPDVVATAILQFLSERR